MLTKANEDNSRRQVFDSPQGVNDSWQFSNKHKVYFTNSSRKKLDNDPADKTIQEISVDFNPSKFPSKTASSSKHKQPSTLKHTTTPGGATKDISFTQSLGSTAHITPIKKELSKLVALEAIGKKSSSNNQKIDTEPTFLLCNTFSLKRLSTPSSLFQTNMGRESKTG